MQVKRGSCSWQRFGCLNICLLVLSCSFSRRSYSLSYVWCFVELIVSCEIIYEARHIWASYCIIHFPLSVIFEVSQQWNIYDQLPAGFCFLGLLLCSNFLSLPNADVVYHSIRFSVTLGCVLLWFLRVVQPYCILPDYRQGIWSCCLNRHIYLWKFTGLVGERSKRGLVLFWVSSNSFTVILNVTAPFKHLFCAWHHPLWNA